MVQLIPVDTDPFAQAPAPAGLSLMPVDHDPFAQPSVMDILKAQPGNAAQAVGDITSLMMRGAAMNKEATPEDAADRSAAMLDLGSRLSGGRVQQPEPTTAPEYKPIFDAQRQALNEASGRAGMAGSAAELIGSLAPMAAVGGVTGLLGRGLESAPIVGKIASNPYVQSAATGAGIGALDTVGTDQNAGTGALIGAGAGLLGKGAGDLAGKVAGSAAGLLNKKPIIPTAEEISAAKSGAYKAADDARVVYTPQLFSRVKNDITSQLTDMGYHPELQPKIASVLSAIDDAAASNQTLKGVDTIRKIAQGAYEPGNKTSNSMMSKIVGSIDNAVATPQAGDVLMGDAQAGAQALTAARKNASIGFKLDDVNRALSKADLRAASTGSGGNVDNATRQELRRVLQQGKSWTPDEAAALDTAIRGTPTQNALRLAGKLSPGGNGLMAALEIGATALNPMMAIPALGGFAAKSTADNMTKRNVEGLLQLIRAGGNRSAVTPPPNALQRLAEQKRGLLSQGATAAALQGLLARTQ
jgi:hypothetical protein